jgi:hypothetical protein
MSSRWTLRISILGLSLLRAGGLLAVDDGHTENPVAPYEPPIRPDQALIIADPRPGTSIHPSKQIVVFMRRFMFNLNPSSVEIYVDGVEYTESLRFWDDRVWLDAADSTDVPPGSPFWNPLREGAHTIEVVARDNTGNTHTEFGGIDVLTIDPGYPPPVDPHAITHLAEDFATSNPPTWHRGLDFRTSAGTPVTACRAGRVVNVENYSTSGTAPEYWEVAVKDDDDLVWQYHHLDANSITVSENEDVVQGQVLGDVVQWFIEVHGHRYDHTHLNVVKWLGHGPVPGPYQDGFEYFNPLRFLNIPPSADTVFPVFGDVWYLPNESDDAFAADSDVGIPVLSGDVDIATRLYDRRTTVAGIPGHPYDLSLYELAYEVIPAISPCGRGYRPRTLLYRFDEIPYGTAIATHNATVLEVFRLELHYQGSTEITAWTYVDQEFLLNMTNTLYGVIDKPGGFWDTDGVSILGPAFPDGSYEVKLYAKDFQGNETVYDPLVDIDNGIDFDGPCPSVINELVQDSGGGGGEGSVWLETGGVSIPAPFGSISINFGPITDGTTYSSTPSWDGWTFPLPGGFLLFNVALRPLAGAEVEYIPYLGDVILKIPAKVEIVEAAGGFPVGSADVNLRLSTRLARNEWTGNAHLGAPHAVNDLRFRLAMADPVSVNGTDYMLRTAEDGVTVMFNLDPTGVSEDPSVDAAPPVGSLRAFPNPFRTRTQIRYRTTAASRVRVVIVDLKGRVVRTVHNAVVPAGSTTWDWDGTDDHGGVVPAGVYFVHAMGADTVSPQKIVRLN